MKRLLAIILAFIILLSAFMPVLAEHIYDEVGNVLKDIEVLKGDEKGNLMLDDNLKRQDMVVMISRLYKEEEKAKNFIGKNVFKDLGAGQKFYVPYITWAKEQGLIEGMEKDKFGFNRYVTVQEFQTVLLRALGYGEEAKDWKLVPEYANSLGIMKDLELNPSNKVTRGEMAYMVLNTLNETKKGSLLTLGDILDLDIPEIFKVDETISIDKNSVNFKGTVQGTDSLKLNLRPTTSTITSGVKIVDIELDSKGNFHHTLENLETGNYEYRFETGKKHTNYKSFKIDEIAFDFVQVKADNLKEIHLVFTKAVDINSASFPSNYNTNAGSIKEVDFREDDKVIVLTLNGSMTQQKQYKISDFKVKSKDGQEVEVRNLEFQAIDRQAPEVISVKQLGNKGVKIELSEPVKSANTRNFKINDKSFSGRVDLDKNTITLLYYRSSDNLKEGKHTVKISDLEDYAGYKLIDVEKEFEVVKDNEAPKIIGSSASLDLVTIEFNEDIDPESAVKTNFYWESRRNKRYPDTVRFSNNKAYLEFRNNKLSYNENTIYVENVSDYSGNKMKLDEVKVTPIIDKTNPEVMSYKVADDGKSITVYYSKDVNGKNRSDYSILDKDDKVVYIRDIQGSGREYIIYLSKPLPIGKNTLTIVDVEDTTTLRNKIIDYKATIDMKDVEKPKIVNYAGYGNYIMLEFSKEMDISTVTDTRNYYIDFDKKIEYLPNTSLITLSNDGKSITILLPERINNKKVYVGDNLKSIEARGLMDTMGNDTDPLLLNLIFDRNTSGKAKAVDYYTSTPGKQGVLVDEDTVKIKFNIPIVSANRSDFSISGRDVKSVEVNGSNELTLYLDYKDRTSLADGDLSIKSNNTMKTYIDTDVEGGRINLVDEVAPRVLYDVDYLYTRDNIIELPFTEELESEGSLLYRRDLEVIRVEDGYLLSESDYSTSLRSNDRSIIQISIKRNNVSSKYSIRVKGEGASGNPTYIRDTSGNLALDSGDYYISDTINR